MNPLTPSVETLPAKDPHAHHEPSQHDHHHDHHPMNKKIVAICIVLMLACLCFAPFSDSTAFQKYSLSVLNGQEAEVAEVTAIAAGLSALVAVVPDDSTTPIADQIASICSKLTYVLVIILFERLLLSFTGGFSFILILPLAFAAFIVHQRTGKHMAKAIGIRLLVLGIIFYSLIPVSTFICTRVNHSLELEKQIDNIRAEANEMDKEEKNDDHWWSSITGTVKGTFNKIFNGVANPMNMLRLMINVVAGMILTDIVIPILVLFIYKWSLQKIIELFFVTQ